MEEQNELSPYSRGSYKAAVAAFLKALVAEGHIKELIKISPDKFSDLESKLDDLYKIQCEAKEVISSCPEDWSDYV